jgi:outer membrane immunogenic protein
MRALRLGAAIVAMAGGLQVGSASADGVIPRPTGPYIYVTPAAMPLAYDWTGIYIGGHAGAANSRTEWVYTGTLDDIEHSHTGFAGGAHLGLQKQWGSVVLGAEVAYTWIDQQETTGSALVADTSLESGVGSLLLVTGKLGVANDNMLAYAKAGYATGEVDFRTRVTSTGVLLTSSSAREHGWTAGVGLEYALWEHVIVGVEYDYVKLSVGTRDQVPTAAGPLGTQVTDAGVDIQSVTARLSVKLGVPRREVEPVK